MNRSEEQSFKARIRNLAREQRISPAALWDSLVLERLLVRIAQSKHSDSFVLKGGVLLARYVDIGRHTQDLDSVVRGINTQSESLSAVLTDILTHALDDGFHFFDLSMRRLDHPHMRYAGARASMKATFGKTRFRVIVDMRVGDFIEPVVQSLPLLSGTRGPLFEGEVQIACYPKEFIFAEKLEAAVYLEGGNSRMKDFHDLLTLIRSNLLSALELDRILPGVFLHRGTAMRLPLNFSDVEYTTLQALWQRHLNSGLSSSVALPNRFRDVISQINQWLSDHISVSSSC